MFANRGGAPLDGDNSAACPAFSHRSEPPYPFIMSDQARFYVATAI
jgi:hypothetical protein